MDDLRVSICSNQEELEKLRNSIEEQRARREECEKASGYTLNVFNTIKDTLVELLIALIEMEENLGIQLMLTHQTGRNGRYFRRQHLNR